MMRKPLISGAQPQTPTQNEAQGPTSLVTTAQHQQALKERQRLIFQCYQHVQRIAKKPAYIKLLRAAEQGLAMVAGYKANRGQ